MRAFCIRCPGINRLRRLVSVFIRFINCYHGTRNFIFTGYIILIKLNLHLHIVKFRIDFIRRLFCSVRHIRISCIQFMRIFIFLKDNFILIDRCIIEHAVFRAFSLLKDIIMCIGVIFVQCTVGNRSKCNLSVSIIRYIRSDLNRICEIRICFVQTKAELACSKLHVLSAQDFLCCKISRAFVFLNILKGYRISCRIYNGSRHITLFVILDIYCHFVNIRVISNTVCRAAFRKRIAICIQDFLHLVNMHSDIIYSRISPVIFSILKRACHCLSVRSDGYNLRRCLRISRAIRQIRNLKEISPRIRRSNRIVSCLYSLQDIERSFR